MSVNATHKLTLMLAFCLLSPSTLAQGKSPFTLLTPNSGASKNISENYLGASIGTAKNDFCDSLESCSDDDNAWKVYTGVPMQNGIILEGGYVNFGEQSGTTTNQDATQVKRSAYTTAGVLNLPYNESLTLFGKAGLAWWKSEETHQQQKQEAEGKDMFYGVGAGFDLGNNLGVRAEWERFKNIGSDKLSDKDIDLLSVGVTMSSL